MARMKLTTQVRKAPVKKRTSIGANSSRSRPNNKSQRRSWKKYRGQGR